MEFGICLALLDIYILRTKERVLCDVLCVPSPPSLDICAGSKSTINVDSLRYEPVLPHRRDERVVHGNNGMQYSWQPCKFSELKRCVAIYQLFRARWRDDLDARRPGVPRCVPISLPKKTRASLCSRKSKMHMQNTCMWLGPATTSGLDFGMRSVLPGSQCCRHALFQVPTEMH